MTDPVHALMLAHDGPVPRHEYAAARYGHRAHERITVGGDMNMIAFNLKCAGVLLRKAVRDERAGVERAAETKARLLLLCRDTSARWRRYRVRYREIMAEIAAVNADVARGLFKQAAE